MSEAGFSRVMVLGDSGKRVNAFHDHVRTSSGFHIAGDPTHAKSPTYLAVDCPAEGAIERPMRTTLAALRRAVEGGLPPVRLKWGPKQPVHVVTLTHWSDGGYVGRCTPRQLRQIARTGEAGFAGSLRRLSKALLPELTFVCGALAPESWMVCWQLVKAGIVRQGVRGNARV